MISQRNIVEAQGEQFGQGFEHFIFTELNAHRSYRELHYDIHFWKTKSGLEVDFILGRGNVAIEVKGTDRVDSHDLKGLRAFCEEHQPQKAILVSRDPIRQKHGDIIVMPWRDFLQELWAGKIIDQA